LEADAMLEIERRLAVFFRRPRSFPQRAPITRSEAHRSVSTSNWRHPSTKTSLSPDFVRDDARLFRAASLTCP
jgi:hypothetical protein